MTYEPHPSRHRYHCLDGPAAGPGRKAGRQPGRRKVSETRFDPELLDHLRELETRLRSPEVAVQYRDQPDSVVGRFVDERRELAVLIERLETARLEVVADRLDHLSGRLRAGVRQLDAHARRRSDVVATLDVLDRVLGIGARIAALAL